MIAWIVFSIHLYKDIHGFYSPKHPFTFFDKKFCTALKMCKFAIPFGKGLNGAKRIKRDGSLTSEIQKPE